jgi:Tol biopolymer transport system component
MRSLNVSLATRVRRAALPLCAVALTAPATPVEPRLVGEGVVSTPQYEGSATLTPDGRTLYYAKRPPVGYFWVICMAQRVGDGWGAPAVAPFSGRFDDTDPFVSPDGARLYFVSRRTADGRPKADHDIWVVERAGDGWGAPRPLPAPINTPHEELHPTVDRDGTLYFASTRPGGQGATDVYRAEASPGGGYATPTRLDSSINSRGPDTQPAISPDGRSLVFTSIGRADEPLDAGTPYVRGDLYGAVRGASGWSRARRLPDGVNTAAAELAPAFTADGMRLLFVSERGVERVAGPALTYRAIVERFSGVRNGLGNVYEVDVRSLALEVAP